MLQYLLLLTPVLLLAAVAASGQQEPLRLHPDNPHYFLFRGQPTVLITSGEHYGAVLNLDFDYVRYLDALQRDRMNCTRTFVGAYCEADTSFKITRNTLSPAPGRFISPWARSDAPGYANGGNKFDLSRWDEAYFRRLKDFVTQAGRRGVVVEINLFCPFYGEEQWALSPLNARNNVNDLGRVKREEVYTLDLHGGLLEVQEQMVRKVVSELRDFDNVYYEIMNEPYIRKVPQDWERHIADVITRTEQAFPHRHLISQNIANGKAKVDKPHPAVSILNFHYAWPPETVQLNYGLNRVIGDNETGFKGTADAHYRREAWAFILAGGGLYNNLDYSFTVGHEDGSFSLPPKQPGGGGATLRRQLAVLGDFIRGFDFVKMRPVHDLVKGALPQGMAVQALAEPGRQYGLYLCHSAGPVEGTVVQLRLELPAADYMAEWVNPVTGAMDAQQRASHPGGEWTLASPPFALDVALRIVAQP